LTFLVCCISIFLSSIAYYFNRFFFKKMQRGYEALRFVREINKTVKVSCSSVAHSTSLAFVAFLTLFFFQISHLLPVFVHFISFMRNRAEKSLSVHSCLGSCCRGSENLLNCFLSFLLFFRAFQFFVNLMFRSCVYHNSLIYVYFESDKVLLRTFHK